VGPGVDTRLDRGSDSPIGMSFTAFASRFRPVEGEEGCSDLNQVIAGAERSIVAIAGAGFSVQLALSPSATLVAVPASALEQIVVGLCSVARSTLTLNGRLWIESRGQDDPNFGPISGVVAVTEARARVLVRAEPGGGSSPESAAPSARPAVELPALEGLLERLGGRLEVLLQPASAPAFVAHLPAWAGTQSAGRIPAALPHEGRVILLVEDEPQVQAVTARILRAFGYAVVTAHNARTALTHAEQYGPAIALVITDLLLPGVSGKDLVGRLRTPCERARVLFISGYSREHLGSLTEGACFLRKPFTAQELLAMVRGLLPEAPH